MASFHVYRVFSSAVSDLPGAAEPPPSSLGAALGEFQLVLGAGGKHRGARGGIGNISWRDREFRLGQGGSKKLV